MHVNGTVLGRHDGIINYTIGQRKGLNIGGSDEPLYVIKIDPRGHKVIVGPRAALGKDTFCINELNWLGTKNLGTDGYKCTVKIRSAQTPLPATVYAEANNKAKVILEIPEYGISAGQACVFYDGSRVLGGGWILRD